MICSTINLFAGEIQNPIVAPQVCHCLLTVKIKFISGSNYCPKAHNTDNNTISNSNTD